MFESEEGARKMEGLKDVDVRDDEKGNKRGNGGDGVRDVGLNPDPLLIELLKKIPPTEAGWPAPQRIRWFRTFAMNVSQIYDNDDHPIELVISARSSADDRHE